MTEFELSAELTIVTVDEVTGVVSRIRIRETSITNWDRKEHVVPHKEFTTGRLLN
jgi:potassium efflux system protein